MKPVLFVLVEKYADWEGAYLAADIMGSSEATGLEVKTVGVQTETPVSIGGFRTLTDYRLETAPQDFAGLVLIGGETWRTPDVEAVAELVKRALALQVPIGFICDSTVFAAKHGFLNHVRHTSNFFIELKEFAGEAYTNAENYLKEPAVLDGQIVTAGGDAPAEFAYQMGKLLKIGSDEQLEHNFVLHKEGLYAACKRDPEWQAFMDKT